MSMTENESVLITLQNAIECATDDVTREDLEMMVKCLEELQQYRAIGTVEEIYNMLKVLNRTVSEIHSEVDKYRAIGTIEEFKALKEKSVAKKPILNNPKIDEFYVKEAKLCPACHSYINNCSGDYCRDCGQHIDWSE